VDSVCHNFNNTMWSFQTSRSRHHRTFLPEAFIQLPQKHWCLKHSILTAVAACEASFSVKCEHPFNLVSQC